MLSNASLEPPDVYHAGQELCSNHLQVWLETERIKAQLRGEDELAEKLRILQWTLDTRAKDNPLTERRRNRTFDNGYLDYALRILFTVMRDQHAAANREHRTDAAHWRQIAALMSTAKFVPWWQFGRRSYLRSRL